MDRTRVQGFPRACTARVAERGGRRGQEGIGGGHGGRLIVCYIAAASLICSAILYYGSCIVPCKDHGNDHRGKPDRSSWFSDST
jgi:hypothetical protein